jgi:hypothetical protein
MMKHRSRALVQAGVVVTVALGLAAIALLSLELSSVSQVGAMGVSEVLAASYPAKAQDTASKPTGLAEDQSDSSVVLLNDWSYTRRTNPASPSWGRRISPSAPFWSRAYTP